MSFKSVRLETKVAPGRGDLSNHSDIAIVYLEDEHGHMWLVYAHHDGGLSVELVGPPFETAVLPQAAGSVVLRKATS